MNAAPRKNKIQPQPQNLDSYAKDQKSFKVSVALPKHEFSGDLKDLDEKLNTMIGRSENMVKQSEGKMIKAYVCQVCGKEGRGIHIRNHIEANHLEGISIPCNVCDQTVRSRRALTQHMSKHYTNTIYSKNYLSKKKNLLPKVFYDIKLKATNKSLNKIIF